MIENESAAWSPHDAEATGLEALTALGLTGHKLQLIRLGQNAIFKVGDQDFVLRVARPGTDSSEVARILDAAALLRANGAPVGEPATLPHGDEPLVFDSGVVAAWKYYDYKGSFGLHDLGRSLANFHRTSHVIASRLSPWSPFEIMRQRLDEVSRIGVPAAWIQDLSKRANVIEDRLEDYRGVLPSGVVHGDMHVGNALNTYDGLIFVDLDNVSLGPRDIDFAPTLVQHRRFGVSSEEWRSFTEGYGLDDPWVFHESPLVVLRELFMITWLLQQYGASNEINGELELRISSLDEDPTELSRWHIR